MEKVDRCLTLGDRLSRFGVVICCLRRVSLSVAMEIISTKHQLTDKWYVAPLPHLTTPPLQHNFFTALRHFVKVGLKTKQLFKTSLTSFVSAWIREIAVRIYYSSREQNISFWSSFQTIKREQFVKVSFFFLPHTHRCALTIHDIDVDNKEVEKLQCLKYRKLKKIILWRCKVSRNMSKEKKEVLGFWLESECNE